MAGHNKWVKIKRKKGINDAKRGQQFTKLGKAITLAAQQGGGDLESNFMLRLAVLQAKEVNMPSDNITRAIKKGTGEIKDGEKVVEVIYEALVADGVALLIKCQTDNPTRTVAEVRQLIEHQYGGKMSPGAVQWQFSEQGQFILRPEVFVAPTQFGKEGTFQPLNIEEMQLNLLEIEGVEDIVLDADDEDQDLVIVYTSRESFADISKQIQKLGYRQEDAEIAWIPKETISLTELQAEKLTQLSEALEENTDVSSIYHNGK